MKRKKNIQDVFHSITPVLSAGEWSVGYSGHTDNSSILVSYGKLNGTSGITLNITSITNIIDQYVPATSNAIMNDIYVYYSLNSGSTLINTGVTSIYLYTNPLTTTTTTTTVPVSLSLTFDDILYADLMISGSSSNVTDWNAFFNLPASGTPFTNVMASGNIVSLYGGSGITLMDGLFDNINGTHLISIVDDSNCIISAGISVFGNSINGFGCPNLSVANLPSLTTAGDYCFQLTSLVSRIYQV